VLAFAAVLLPLLAAAAAAALAAGEEQAEPPPTGTPASVVGSVRPEPAGRPWFLLPVPFWLPETKLGLALAGGRDFLAEGSRRHSTAVLVAAYSIAGQGSIDGSADLWFRGGSLVSARARAVHYHDAYYGVGSGSPGGGHEDFTRRFVELTATGELATLDGRLRAGPRLAGRIEEVTDVVPGGSLATSGLQGLDGVKGLGAGASVTWDTRDHPLLPRHGTFAQLYYLRYPAGLGDHGGFGKGALDLRAFTPAGGERVLGLSAVVETADGAAPFTLLSKLGNARFLRGYREGRYRDRIAWAAQAEVRAPVRGPFALAVFGAAGDVAPDLGSIAAGGVKLAGGAGARWRLTPAGASARLDVAVGSAGPEVYVLLLEAF
jgi:hypothetical protein